MVDLWRDFWIRDTGTGQQVAQLHDRYMVMMIQDIILLFRIPMGKRNKFFYEMFRQYGYVTSKKKKKVRQPWPTMYHWHCLWNVILARPYFRLSHLHSSGSPSHPLISTVRLSNCFGLCHAASMFETCSGICEGGRHTSCIGAKTEMKRRTSVKNCTKLPTGKVQWIACQLPARSKHQTKQAWARSTNSLHDMDIRSGKTVQRFTQKYEGCPESIQPFWISREPVEWPWCNLAASQRRPYCASVNSHSSVRLDSRQWDAVHWACVMRDRRIHKSPPLQRRF